MTTLEPLSDEELADIRSLTSPGSARYLPLSMASLTRLLDEHARLKATVERVRFVMSNIDFGDTLVVSRIRLEDALSPDASTTEELCPICDKVHGPGLMHTSSTTEAKR